MENSLGDSDVFVIPKKPRSLDLHSVYIEKDKGLEGGGGEDGGGLKRKRGSSSEGEEESGCGQGEKKYKSVSDVSDSSHQSVNTKSRSSSNGVDGDKLSQLVFEKKKTKDHASGGNLLKLGGGTGVSSSFGENVISIPKRPRCFSRTRRKNFESNGDFSKVNSDAVSNKIISDAAAPMLKSNDHSVTPIPSSSSGGVQKKVNDELRKNSSSRGNSATSSKLKDGSSVRYRDSISEIAQRNHGKGKKLKRQESSHGNRVEHLVDKTSKPHEDLEEDDEENLEENAARMLSARFDPSCTVFSGNVTASASQSANLFSFGSSIHGNLASPRERRSSGLESISDAAGRVLRPRKQGKEKRGTRKRRHFYEILFRDVDAYWVVNRRIKVFWPLDQSWYFGLVCGYDPKQMLHHVKYDDREEEWIDLQNERFKLLLLPSEVPRKSKSKKSRRGGKPMVEKTEGMDVEDDDCGGSYMDSEPIISWLARSNRRVKSSPLGIMKKHKTNVVSKKGAQRMSSEDSVGTSHGCLDRVPRRIDTIRSSDDLELPDRSADKEKDEKEMVNSTSCSRIREVRFVYSRKRFRQRGHELGCISQSTECRSTSSSLQQSGTGVAGGLKPNGIASQSDVVEDMAPDLVSWSGENLGLLKLTVRSAESKVVHLSLRVPLQWACFAHGSENISVYHTLYLLQYGTVMVRWPKVQLQMLFVDNVVGLRFLLFEGCLMQAVAFVCLILVVFKQHTESGALMDPQLPVTSIRLDLSDFQNFERRLVFTFYNYLEVNNSKWLYLDGKLKHYCSVTKQLPLSECTYDNIKILQSRSSQIPISVACEDPISHEGPLRRSRKSGMHMGMYKESANACMAISAANFNEKPKKLPPVVLPFSAAPTFFLNLHLKLLMAQSVASISFVNPLALLEGPENSGETMANGEVSDQVTTDNDTEFSLSHNVTGSALVSYAESKVEVDDLSISNEGVWTESPQKCASSEYLVAETSSVGLGDSGRDENDGNIDLQRHPNHHSGPEKCNARLWPSIPEGHSTQGKPELERFSHLNNLTVQIPALNEEESLSCDVGAQSAPQSTSELVWRVKDSAIRSPNPTAPRSMWHRNRHNSGSMSFGYCSRIWPDGREDLSNNGLPNGSKKPRSQVSYLLPFGNCDFSSRPRSNHRKGRPYKRIRTDSEKTVPSGSRSPQRHPELLSCDGNLLIIEGDRGWRECGAHVVLECLDRNDWRLLVKLSGVVKYSHKPCQFLQPGSTNRYTHAMIWKGGKDWSLEFPDRSQWIVFKEMHEECYNRNIRAASVKSIPIPGVRLIEENEDHPVEVPFVRSSPMYIQQAETEVEMALDPSHVLYDIESDDEEWISKCRMSSEACASNFTEISEEMFERTMDLFEKAAYAHLRENFTSDEIEELMAGLGPIHLVKDIYEYWQQKRRRKGRPLIRQFQPPLWEKYQKQLKEWESLMNRFPNGCKEKAILIQKPPMYAFCLRPRGLDVPHKGSKQRSHRKLSSSGHNYSFSRDADGHHGFGRRSNGFVYGEERLAGGPNHDSLYASSWHTSTRVASPREAISTGYLSMSSDGSERNQYRKTHRNKSKRIKTIISSNDSQLVSTPYNQKVTSKRNGSSRWNVGVPEWPSQKQYHHPEGFQRHRVEKLGGAEFDEFRLRDASSAAQHASNMAKLKREKAQRLLYRADLAIHKAMVALMTAEAIKASSEDSTDDS